MLQPITDLKDTIIDLIVNQTQSVKGNNLYVVTGVNSDLTINIKELNLIKSYNNVQMLGQGFGNFKGQIKLPAVNDIVLVSFITESETPIIMGTLFDIYSTTKDGRFSIKSNEYFVNGQTNGAFILIDEDNNIILRTPNGSKIKLNEDGSFKLFNKDNYGIEVSSTGVMTLRRTSQVETTTQGTW